MLLLCLLNTNSEPPGFYSASTSELLSNSIYALHQQPGIEHPWLYTVFFPGLLISINFLIFALSFLSYVQKSLSR